MWVWEAVSGMASFYGAIRGSQAADEAGNARAAAMETNAKYLREQAEFATKLGASRQLQYEDQANRFRSKQSGLFAKAGVDLTGSVLQKLGETSTRTADQLAQIKWTTENEVRFANLKASQSMLTASQYRAAIPAQQSLAWAQGIGGAAPALAKLPWGKVGGSFSKFGSSLLSGYSVGG